jgi:predicted nuclease of predicted toxin-antitoxin system
MAVKLKTDENLPSSAAMLLRTAGHDVTTIVEEKLGGAADPNVAEVCRSEERALVTLDRGLGNIRAYPPTDYHGIVVLRPREQSLDAILELVKTFATLLESNTLAGTLWIVDERRFRIRR